MPTSSVGSRARSKRAARGVTLIEMMVVVAIAGLIAAVAAPAVSTGLDSVRMVSAADSVSAFLNSAVNRSERRQQAVALVISPKERRLTMYSNEPGFERRLDLPDGITLEAILPRVPDEPDGERRLLLMPGGAVPGIGIQLANSHGAHRIVRLDPMTGFPRVESVTTE